MPWWDISGSDERDRERREREILRRDAVQGPFESLWTRNKRMREHAEAPEKARLEAERQAEEQKKLEHAQDVLERVRAGKPVPPQEELDARRTVEWVQREREKRAPKAQGWPRAMRNLAVIAVGVYALINYQKILAFMDGSRGQHAEDRPPSSGAGLPDPADAPQKARPALGRPPVVSPTMTWNRSACDKLIRNDNVLHGEDANVADYADCAAIFAGLPSPTVSECPGPSTIPKGTTEVKIKACKQLLEETHCGWRADFITCALLMGGLGDDNARRSPGIDPPNVPPVAPDPAPPPSPAQPNPPPSVVGNVARPSAEMRFARLLSHAKMQNGRPFSDANPEDYSDCKSLLECGRSVLERGFGEPHEVKANDTSTYCYLVCKAHGEF